MWGCLFHGAELNNEAWFFEIALISRFIEFYEINFDEIDADDVMDQVFTSAL